MKPLPQNTPYCSTITSLSARIRICAVRLIPRDRTRINIGTFDGLAFLATTLARDLGSIHLKLQSQWIFVVLERPIRLGERGAKGTMLAYVERRSELGFFKVVARQPISNRWILWIRSMDARSAMLEPSSPPAMVAQPASPSQRHRCEPQLGEVRGPRAWAGPRVSCWDDNPPANGGVSWQICKPAGTSADLHSIKFVDTRHGWSGRQRRSHRLFH